MKLRDMAGSWALVSGASSGIGREFCVQLAAAGADLVLVARRQELLDELAAELGRRHGVRCAVVAIDLTEPNAPARLKARLDELKIHPRLLVNNAGSG
ncbi:MAG TPA: SDR family NAD(P)-dependent oxidoreductase, partial [Zoogloea sp.]|nr:SDR family NAD(P)-dependent oxidoreductase [Zoogloea sp.]